jgi:hypothetical protein
MRYSVVIIPIDEVKLSLYDRLKVSTEFNTDNFDVAQQMLAILADIYQMPKPEWSDVPGELEVKDDSLILKIVMEEEP